MGSTFYSNFMKTFLALIIMASIGVSSAWAHGGGTDKNGCHRDTKAGTRHCH